MTLCILQSYCLIAWKSSYTVSVSAHCIPFISFDKHVTQGLYFPDCVNFWTWHRGVSLAIGLANILWKSFTEIAGHTLLSLQHEQSHSDDLEPGTKPIRWFMGPISYYYYYTWTFRAKFFCIKHLTNIFALSKGAHRKGANGTF